MKDAIEAWAKRHITPRRRRDLTAVRLACRRPTAQARPLPNCLIIGTMRGGTSSLYKYLSFHPEVSAALRKEVSYFGQHHARGELWYRSHFGPVSVGPFGSPKTVTFEATPSYMVEPHVAGRVAAELPGARVIALLRDPVERAFSHYQHMVRHGFETKPFEEAVDLEQSRVGADYQRMLDDPDYYSPRFQRFSYTTRGFYGQQLERWWAAIPGERILVLRSEDFYASPAATLGRIQAFLGLSSWQPATFRNFSYVGQPPARAAIPGDVRARLDELFAEDQRKLEALLEPHEGNSDTKATLA